MCSVVPDLQFVSTVVMEESSSFWYHTCNGMSFMNSIQHADKKEEKYYFV